MAVLMSMNESSPSPQELREAAAHYRAESADLKFPVDPTFNPKPPRMTPTEHLLWCEELIRLGVVTQDEEKRLREKRVTAEFIF